MLRKYSCLVIIIQIVLLFINQSQTVQNFEFESEIGSTITLPPCFSITRSSTATNEHTTMLFKSDSGELISMNGKLVSNNPRFDIQNSYSSNLMIQSVELSDEGQYECRTDETIQYIAQLTVINSSTIHLTVLEGTNLTLQCAEDGMWIIEESHRGGPVRTQYTNELELTNIQRNDDRFRTITCSTRNGHERRKYLVDVRHKPTVQLLMLTKHSLICIICARPLPHRIEWWRNRQKERDDHIHQTNINQSCIVQQFTLSSKKDFEQTIVCEAENVYGIERASIQLNNNNTIMNNHLQSTKNLLLIPNEDSSTVATPIFSMNISSMCSRTISFSRTIFFCMIFVRFFF